MGIAGYSVKNIRKTTGREGDGLLCSLYRDGRRVAIYADYGDGAGGTLDFSSREESEQYYRTVWNSADRWIQAEKAVDKDSLDAGPLRRLLDMTEDKLRQPSGYSSLDEEYGRISRAYPFLAVRKQDITPERLIALEPDIFIQTLVYVKDMCDFRRRTAKKYPGTHVCLFGDGSAQLMPDHAAPADGCVYTAKTEADFDF